jgi:hypothetical protein
LRSLAATLCADAQTSAPQAEEEAPMTNLPATRVEAEALLYARKCVRYLHDGSVRGYGVSWFSKEGGRRLTRIFWKSYALHNQFTMDEVVASAMAGGHDEHEALGELITEFHARGQQLPPQLATYDVHAWNRRLSSPPGRRKSDNVTRNLAFALVIDALVKHFGVKPTKNRAARRPAQRQSASSILAEALKQELPDVMFKPTVRAIEFMWQDSGPGLVACNAGSFPPITFPAP